MLAGDSKAFGKDFLYCASTELTCLFVIGDGRCRLNRFRSDGCLASGIIIRTPEEAIRWSVHSSNDYVGREWPDVILSMSKKEMCCLLSVWFGTWHSGSTSSHMHLNNPQLYNVLEISQVSNSPLFQRKRCSTQVTLSTYYCLIFFRQYSPQTIGLFRLSGVLKTPVDFSCFRSSQSSFKDNPNILAWRDEIVVERGIELGFEEMLVGYHRVWRRHKGTPNRLETRSCNRSFDT